MVYLEWVAVVVPAQRLLVVRILILDNYFVDEVL
jgi:hypothetical protein